MIISPKARVEISRSLDSWTIDFGFVGDRFELGHGDGPLFAGLQQSGKNLLTIETLAPSVFLDHHVGDFIDALVTGESALASQAMPPPPNGLAFLAFPRIDHLVLKVAAKRTFHIVSDWGFRMVLRISRIVRPSFSIHGIVVASGWQVSCENAIMAADNAVSAGTRKNFVMQNANAT